MEGGPFCAALRRASGQILVASALRFRQACGLSLGAGARILFWVVVPRHIHGPKWRSCSGHAGLRSRRQAALARCRGCLVGRRTRASDEALGGARVRNGFVGCC